MKLTDRIVVITAAGSGMGRAAALRFAAEGAHVVVTDLSQASADKVVAEIVAHGDSGQGHALDVSDRHQVAALINEIGAQHGHIHVLFNHAGVPGAAGLDIDDEAWRSATDVNMKGAFFATAAAVPWLRKAGTGAVILFTSSVSGLVGSPLSPLYSMTKGGIVTLMKSLALQLAPDGIRVNAICPGPIATAMLPEFFGRESGEGLDDVIDRFVTAIPMGRAGRPEEIAAAAVFLASDDASFITGVALPVDGGYLAR